MNAQIKVIYKKVVGSNKPSEAHLWEDGKLTVWIHNKEHSGYDQEYDGFTLGKE